MIPKTLNPLTWRRERDSNPRYRFRYAAFPMLCIRPLCHLSVQKCYLRILQNFIIATAITVFKISAGMKNKNPSINADLIPIKHASHNMPIKETTNSDNNITTVDTSAPCSTISLCTIKGTAKNPILYPIVIISDGGQTTLNSNKLPIVCFFPKNTLRSTTANV